MWCDCFVNDITHACLQQVKFIWPICGKLIKTSIISSEMEYTKDTPGNSMSNTCFNVNFVEDGTY